MYRSTLDVNDSASVAYLGLGSSMGDRLDNLRYALEQLEASGSETRVLAISSVYETPHMGLALGDEVRYPPHLNAVASVATSLSPSGLLALAQRIEDARSRQRVERWGPRTLDLDILLFGNLTLSEPHLVLPHPGIVKRNFVVVPLFEIAADLIFPNGTALRDVLADFPQGQLLPPSIQIYGSAASLLFPATDLCSAKVSSIN